MKLKTGLANNYIVITPIKIFFLLSSIFTLSNAVKVVRLPNMSPEHVFPIVKNYLPTNCTILEAGAYDGNDTRSIKQVFPASKIYCFEPVPQIFERYKNNTRDLKDVYGYQLALSDKLGKAEFYVSEDPGKPGIKSMSSSLREPKDHLKYSAVLFPEKCIVETITIDEWALKNGIDHIDFIWLDLQGSELETLKSSPKVMKTVQVIYTEIEFVEAYKGQALFQDIEKWMTEQGFVRIAQDFDLPPKDWFGNAIYVRSSLVK